MSSSRAPSVPTQSSGTVGRGIADATQLCTDLTHQTVLLEKQLDGEEPKVFGMLSIPRPSQNSHPGSEIGIVQAILGRSIPWFVSAVQKADDDAKKSGIKVVQAVEKFRRLIIRAKSAEPNSNISETLVQLLHDVASCFNSAFEQVWNISRPSISDLTAFYSPRMRSFDLLSSTRFWYCRKVG